LIAFGSGAGKTDHTIRIYLPSDETDRDEPMQVGERFCQRQVPLPLSHCPREEDVCAFSGSSRLIEGIENDIEPALMVMRQLIETHVEPTEGQAVRGQHQRIVRKPAEALERG